MESQELMIDLRTEKTTGFVIYSMFNDNAFWTVESIASALTITYFALSYIFRINSIVSNQSIFGINRSINTMSGLNSFIFSKDSKPLVATLTF